VTDAIKTRDTYACKNMIIVEGTGENENDTA
jgi:hypothetical protein